jgi:uncharacterized delta-60 repeat protein
VTTLGEKVPPNRLIRLNADGSLDPTFKPSPQIGDYPSNVVAQADGKLLVSSSGTNMSAEILVRLEPDGALDSAYRPQIADQNQIVAVSVQPDGKALLLLRRWLTLIVQPGVTSSTTSIQTKELSTVTTGPAPVGQVVRLNSDGSPDFASNFDSSYLPGFLSLQPDGKILVVGVPLFLLASPENNDLIVRLNSNGGTDTTFTETEYAISEIVSLPDGAYLAIIQAGDNVLSFVQRLNADFTIDATFKSTPAREFALQADGKIIVNANKDLIQPGAGYGISRLNSDGSVDASFQTDLNLTLDGSGDIHPSVALEADGGILVFAPDSTITRVNDALSSQSLNVENSSSIQWLRGGTAPEIESASFDLSQDHGRTWLSLGDAIRIQGGWNLDGASIPPGGLLRARGIPLTSLYGGSSSEIEQYHYVPAIGSH